MLWICRSCTARYSVGAPACPECGSTEYAEEGQEMPKITRHGGPSFEPAETDEAEQTDNSPELVGEGGPELPEAVEGDQVEREHPGTGEPMTAVDATADGTERELVVGDDAEGGEQSSPGNNSSASTAKPKKSTGPSKTSPQRRAPSTGNRSKPDQAESSSAASTAGSTPETTSPDKAD